MATPNYEIDYNDKRFTEVEADKKAALSEVESTYGGMISNSDKFYQNQIDAAEKWGETQKQNQQAQTDFAIQKIEQQKAQAQSDYTKEQSAAYKDYQKQINPYGAQAEQMAAQGLSNTGYAESSKVDMYVQYQNRVAIARESIKRAELEFDNQMTQARLQNSSILAEIAYNTLKEVNTLALEGFQYKNNLLLEQANKKTELEQMYHNRYQDVLAQINTENKMAEEVRQYNENLAEEKRQYNETLSYQKQKAADDKAYQNAQLALEREKFSWQKAQASSSGSGGSGTIKKSSSSSKGSSSGSSKSISKPKYSVSGALEKMSGSGKSSKSNSPTVDMNSVLALGYGPISASKLASLVNNGTIKQYTENGKIKYKKVLSSGAGKKTWLTTHFK